ncbi:beta propeller repeat protein [Natronorubrum thiooxidans]|uniref:Photosynthesis system II assembly factor Ycf48/Hcf136-like domain-containing protein n=1 Tax=Natronorubrum thiooxidans TaxID=308853 RepID=A0A1N7CQC6_9EURY|nr:hypothetical protein [Natronorubrum thiooxidans]SIR65809.1 Uncharacterized protein SAMN05421752_101512 [Natronorubrum thiooxidans]
MTSQTVRLEAGGFVPFFRSYTRTWIHAVATAGLTAFGTLTIVHRWFAGLALAAYVVPPIVLYLRQRGRVEDDSESRAEATPREHSELDDERPPSEGERRADQNDASPVGWNTAETPTDATLHDVTVTTSNDGYAVGDGGLVLASEGDEWETVLEDGPAAQGNNLRGADATADGEAIWIAGDSGSLGRVDGETGRHTDYTAPAEITGNWLGVAVDGSSGEETIVLITGSGGVVRGTYHEGDLEWSGPKKPGSGSSLRAVSLADAAVGYCCDTNDGVFETTNGGESFDRVGLEGADGTLTDVATAGRGDCVVSDDDGTVHRYDGSRWTPERVATGSVSGVARHEERTVACTADGSVFERPSPEAAWERLDTDVSGGLVAVSLGPDRSVAVGADGLIVERGRR